MVLFKMIVRGMRVFFPTFASGMLVLLTAEILTYLDQHCFLSLLIEGDEISMLSDRAQVKLWY